MLRDKTNVDIKLINEHEQDEKMNHFTAKRILSTGYYSINQCMMSEM